MSTPATVSMATVVTNQTLLTSGIPAHSSQLSSSGLCTSICVLTQIYSAYAPPYASPNTASPFLKPRSLSPAKSSMVPLNSTPSVLGACGGTGYFPSLCRRSMRLRPKHFTLIRACACVGFGRSMSVMCRFSIPPLPSLMSGGNQYGSRLFLWSLRRRTYGFHGSHTAFVL